MKSLVVAALVAISAAPALAETPSGPQPEIRWVPVQTPPAAAVSSRIIYIKKCPIALGCTVHPGTDDSRTQTSSLAPNQLTITEYKQGDAVWQKVMECVKNTYAPFDVTVTDVDPGNVPHFENIVGGNSGTELSPDLSGAGGVSPFTCAEIPNAITYTFDLWGPDPDKICAVISQETAHAFGLEHEYNASDPLTYLQGGPSMKRFQATDSPCGTFSALPTCMCPPTHATQNSYKTIVGFFGPGAATPPTIDIKAPTDGKTVQPHFVVRANASDDVGVDHVELWIDNLDTGVKAMTPPYRLTAPDGIDDGPHTIEARAIDVQGVPASATVDVDMGPPCTAASGCTGDDVCVMGTCVPGPAVPGGLGDRCTANTECLAVQCVSDGHQQQCVENCDLGATGSCPDNFSCIAGGANGGVCWYNGDSGCCSVGAAPTAPLYLGAGVLGVLVLRRRRRSR